VAFSCSSPASATSSTHHQPGLDGLPRPTPLGRGLRRLEVVKTNLCRHPPPLGLIFEGENVPVPTLHYTPFVEPPPQPSQVDLCARWLLRFLTAAGAPAKPADVARAAREAGFPRRTLYRARNALADSVVDLGNSPRDPHRRWALAAAPSPTPPQEVPPPETAHRHSGTVAQ
jgi:hypothetical protein